MSTLKEREEYALSRIKESPLKVNINKLLDLSSGLEKLNTPENSSPEGTYIQEKIIYASPNSESDTRGY